MIRINEIDGIPLHYAREPQHPYGTIGRPISFYVEENFNEKLVECFKDLFDACPLGKPNVITCGGIYNPEHHNPRSTHRHGTGFDFDAAFWDNFTLITKRFHHYKELYLGMECFIRIHFGIVLNYFFNALHEDHWHFDASVTVDFRTNYRSSILHLQLVLLHIYEKQVQVDGIWGPQTQRATQDVLDRLGISSNITSISNYKSFLRKTGLLAFKIFEQAKSPLILLNDVYAIIEDLNIDHQSSSSLIEGLNAFRSHEETESWLSNNFADGSNLDAMINDIS